MALSLLALASTAAPTSASTVVGVSSAATPDIAIICMPVTTPCAQTVTLQNAAVAHRAPGGATVSSFGVITSWSMTHGQVVNSSFMPATATSLTVNLRVIRGAGAAGIGAGKGPTEQLPQVPGTYTFPARLGVQAGDRIGYDLSFTPGNYGLRAATSGGSGDEVGYAGIWPEGGTSPGYFSSGASYTYLPMNVTIEPDIDGDGYGDETQDGCPTNAAAQGPCPGPPDTFAPETAITKKPPKKARKKVAFSFESSEPGSTFECALDGKGVDQLLKEFHACTSPRAYSGLKPGRFEFRVRAIDAAGNVDASPGLAKFKVAKKKHKKH